MTKRPSLAQARDLAWMFGTKNPIRIASDPADRGPTRNALINNGWVEGGIFPSGAPYTLWNISAAGIDALARFLMTWEGEK